MNHKHPENQRDFTEHAFGKPETKQWLRPEVRPLSPEEVENLKSDRKGHAETPGVSEPDPAP